MGTTYQLCHYSDTVSGLANIITIVDDVAATPFPATFTPYTAIVGTGLNLATIKQGLPMATWHWDFLTQADYNALMHFEGEVFICTRTDQGTFANYSGTMVMGGVPNPRMGKLRDSVDVSFYNLVAV
mgnify:CR=1 FL=1